jgi:signal transduction histidine kinase
LEANLYLADQKLNGFGLIAKTHGSVTELHAPLPHDVHHSAEPYYTERDSLVLTIRGKKSLIDQLPFHLDEDVLGLLELYPMCVRSDHDMLFFQKYANRIGFNLHNWFLDEKNIEHLRFIRSLVADIEHNIIVPNMIYKLFLKRLRGRVKKNVEIEKALAECSAGSCEPDEMVAGVLRDLQEVNEGLTAELENIEKHYRNMSLFIETLFRKSHFDQGRLTLRTKTCNMKKDVVQPQLERFLEQLGKEGISIDDRLSGIPEEEVINVVDVGLMAQVYANLFSNALKYTREVEIFGGKKKYIAYGHEVVKDFFGAGSDGVKYNVFSSGPNIPEEERKHLYEEEFRGSNAEGKSGTGHGLAFIKNVVEIHGGAVGYEAMPYGNNFYFILPK